MRSLGLLALALRSADEAIEQMIYVHVTKGGHRDGSETARGPHTCQESRTG